MFTGIVQTTGKILCVEKGPELLEIWVKAPENFLKDIKIDDSVAVNGVCQTVVEIGQQSFRIQVIFSTLTKTTLGLLVPGQKVNLELALRFGDRLGGHLVSGHVQTFIKVLKIDDHGDSKEIFFELPEGQTPYISAEGSVTIDGVSLTVNQCSADQFSVGLIPHTLSHTTLGEILPGDYVNLEVDLLAKYLHQLAKPLLKTSGNEQETPNEIQLN